MISTIYDQAVSDHQRERLAAAREYRLARVARGLRLGGRRGWGRWS